MVSQQNQRLLTGVSLTSSLHTSSLSAVFVTSLLTSVQLPALIALNSKRLSESYRILVGFLQKREIEFIPANAGLFVFARLAKGCRSWEEEAMIGERLKENGVLVSPGRTYHGLEEEKGWMRITLAVPEDTLREGLERVQRCLSRADM